MATEQKTIEVRNKVVSELIQLQKECSFINPDGIEDTEAFGILIANHFEWDIVRIGKTFLAALKDANAHTLAEGIQELLEYEGFS